jgi:branched-chain amino acid transport system substrate-binding protein
MKALEDDAKESDTILIGFGSTTPGISSTENTIIRLCPDDTVQALALQRYFKKTNITTVIPVVRNDIYGRELYEQLNNLSPNGNFTVTEPIYYEPGTSSFNQIIDEVSKSVQDAGSKSGLAVLIIGYNEATDILKVASEHPDLEKVSWFGTDGIALVDTVTKNKDIAAFAAKTNFTASIFGELENEPSFLEFSKRIQDAAGMNATPYAVVINDCVQLAAMTDLMSQGISNKRAIFVNNANHFYGVTGYTSLTDLGDRKYSNIDFWRIKENEGSYSWTKTAQFINQMAGPMVNLKK